MSKTGTNFLVFLCATGLTLSAAAGAEVNVNKSFEDKAGTTFTTVIEDLPLMPGLDPVEEKDVLFRKDSLSHCPLLNARTFERDGERLRLDVSSVNRKAMTVARFSVQPVKDE